MQEQIEGNHLCIIETGKSLDGSNLHVLETERTPPGEKNINSQIREGLDQDSYATEVRAGLEQGKDGFEDWQVDEGLLYYDGTRLYVPAGRLRALVLSEFHDSPYAGHFGKERTTEAIS
ncbi:MAG: hypothetical protein M1823_006629, partial [Watsoniomyces obsoletus]